MRLPSLALTFALTFAPALALFLPPLPAMAAGRCLVGWAEVPRFALIDGGSTLPPAAFAEVARLIARLRGWRFDGCDPAQAAPFGEAIPEDVALALHHLLTASFPDGPEQNVPEDLRRALHLGVPATACLDRRGAWVENHCPVAVTLYPVDGGAWLQSGVGLAIPSDLALFACPAGTTAEGLRRDGGLLVGYCRLPQGGMP